MNKIKKKKLTRIIVGIIIVVVLVIIGGVITSFIIKNNTPIAQEPENNIVYSDDNVPAFVSTSYDKVEVVHLPTVKSIDSEPMPNEDSSLYKIINDYYHKARTYSPFVFKDDVIGKCLDSDGSFGSQCYDLANVYWQNYAKRTLSTCGTGAAKGTLNCYQHNAGSEFEMVWNTSELQPGDWIVFGSGEWGHIGMAMGYPNNGYITLLGQNQGGQPCEGGGSSANLINISLQDFKGAFRPIIYKQIKPTPISPDSGIVKSVLY